jgi:hypothetical protein
MGSWYERRYRVSPTGHDDLMTARAALATGAIMAGTATAHIWAGGELPSVGWIAMIGALVLAATRAVFRGRVGAPVMVLGLGIAQLGVHALLTAMTVQPTHHQAGHHQHVASGSVGPDLLSIGWQMAMAHALSAGITALVWWFMAGALQEIFELPDQPSLAVSDRRARLVSDGGHVVRPAPGWRSGAPRRGPPRAPLPQIA